jgi:hypothetical protein
MLGRRTGEKKDRRTGRITSGCKVRQLPLHGEGGLSREGEQIKSADVWSYLGVCFRGLATLDDEKEGGKGHWGCSGIPEEWRKKRIQVQTVAPSRRPCSQKQHRRWLHKL